MKKLMLTVIAGCMSVALGSAYAATGSPADSDKAGRQGTGAPELGATDPNAPTRAAPGATKGGASTTGTPAGAAGATKGGASTTGTPAGAAGASSTAPMDDTRKGRTRRAARAEKG